MVVWSGDDAAATASDGHLCAFEDQISEPPQVAEFAQSLRVETGQYRDDENFQIRAALASRRGADDVPVPMDRDTVDAAFGGSGYCYAKPTLSRLLRLLAV
jgi:hypothetical protein